MLKLIKKSAFIGLGLAAMSATALEQLGERIAKEAKLSEEEGQKLVDDLMEQSKKSREDLMNTVEKTVKETLKNMDVVTTDDLKSIERRLRKIEKSLDQKPKPKAK